MSPGLWKPQDEQGILWRQPAEACCAVGGRGDTRQDYLQEVSARGRGRGARARAAPSPAAQPPGSGAEGCAKARAEKFLPYLLLISNYLDLGKAKTDLSLIQYCTSRLAVDCTTITAHSSFVLKTHENIFFFSLKKVYTICTMHIIPLFSHMTTNKRKRLSLCSS